LAEEDRKKSARERGDPEFKSSALDRFPKAYLKKHIRKFMKRDVIFFSVDSFLFLFAFLSESS